MTTDRIFIKDLLLRGVIGATEEERQHKQDIVINATLWVDTRPAGLSDALTDTVNYYAVAERITEFVQTATAETAAWMVERLAVDLVKICLQLDPLIEAAEITVEKTTAVRFTRSVGVTIYRKREEVNLN